MFDKFNPTFFCKVLHKLKYAHIEIPYFDINAIFKARFIDILDAK